MLSNKRKYTSNKCTYCKNYLYLSSLQCNNCGKNLCSKHLDKCTCEEKQWTLMIRELNQDRTVMEQLVPEIGPKQEALK